MRRARADSRNTFLAGTSVVSGDGKALVFATGWDSAFGRIAHLTQATADTISPLQLEIVRVSRIVAGLALALGLSFFLIGRAIGLSFWENLIFAIGIIVANVPEGLLPTVTLALAMGSQRVAKRNALIRHLPAVEALGCISVMGHRMQDGPGDGSGHSEDQRVASCVRTTFNAWSFPNRYDASHRSTCGV